MHATILNAAPIAMTPEKAEAVAAAAQASETDGWTYVARHSVRPDGPSYVEIFDEDGEKLGRL